MKTKFRPTFITFGPEPDSDGNVPRGRRHRFPPGRTGQPNNRILDFVVKVTREGGPDFVHARGAHRHLR